MTKTINMTREGGNYYRAMAFQFAFVGLTIAPVAILLLLALINPFWFREDMFGWMERIITRVTTWRNYTTYRIYLGCDPKLWHTLKGDV